MNKNCSVDCESEFKLDLLIRLIGIINRNFSVSSDSEFKLFCSLNSTLPLKCAEEKMWIVIMRKGSAWIKDKNNYIPAPAISREQHNVALYGTKLFSNGRNEKC